MKIEVAAGFIRITSRRREPRWHSGLSAVLQIGRSLVGSHLVSLVFSLTSNPSDRTMALGSTQPVTEMTTTSVSWG